MTGRWFLGTVQGEENLPTSGGFLLVANHSSFMDHFVVATILKQYRQSRVYYLTKKEAFIHPLSRMWHLSVGCIPLNRESADTAAFRMVLKYLSEGKIVCIYPEGTRSPTGMMLRGKSGAVKLALLGKVPIVPVGLNGTFDILPKYRLVPRLHRATVEIGVPILPESFGKKGDELEQATSHIMAELSRLSHQMIDDKSTSPENPTIEERIHIARQWNELGIHPTPSTPFSPEVLHDRAKYICEEILKEDRQNADAYFELGRAYGRLALISKTTKKLRWMMKARKMFRRALSYDENHAHALYALAMWHMEVPKWLGAKREMALQLYQQAVECNPDEVFLYMGLAKCQVKLGRVDDAMKTLEKVLQVPSHSHHDVRRKIEALAQMLRINPEYRLESGLMKQCFKNLATG
ncbi:1-acyl-sn-glycerol-3-phosphate acyltransferase [Alicyclobacillus sp. SO9]|nr:1-acyl-sn-glycerol-3-phosphate acyltransferase [Alicyclobacillus sp. SO9]